MVYILEKSDGKGVILVVYSALKLPLWDIDKHKPLIIMLFLPIVSYNKLERCFEYKSTNIVKGRKT